MSTSVVRASFAANLSVKEAVFRIRSALERGYKDPASSAKGRVPALYKNTIVRALPKLGKIADIKKRRQPIKLLHFDRDDLVHEAVVFVLEEATRTVAPISIDWVVRRGERGIDRVYLPHKKRYPDRLNADCLVDLAGRTPIDAALSDAIVTYARGPIDHLEDLHALLRQLPRRHRIVLTLRYGLDGRSVISRKRIAEALGFCETTIDRIEAEAIEVLRWWTIEAEAAEAPDF